jgi:hypothetical protein
LHADGARGGPAEAAYSKTTSAPVAPLNGYAQLLVQMLVRDVRPT